MLNATAGWGSDIARMVGLELPMETFPLQACVTEPLKPFLDVVVVSGSLHVYVSQSDRGELVMGASIDPFTSYSVDSSLDFLEGIAGHVLELFPFLGEVKVLRQWAGLCEMPPDFSPLMGVTPVDGFLLDVGWGTYGFKASPICGQDHGRADRDEAHPGADRPVPAVPVRRVRPGRRERGGLGRPLTRCC